MTFINIRDIMTSQRGQIYINYGSNLNIENKEIERERENFATL